MSKSKEEYIRKVENTPEIPIFYQAWYLDAVSGANNWEALTVQDKAGKITGVWPFNIQKKWGFKYSTAFNLSPYTGPFLFYPSFLTIHKQLSFERKTITDLAKQIKQQGFVFFNQFASPYIDNLQALVWEGFENKMFYRSVIPKYETLGDIEKNIKANKKYSIKKFQTYGKIRVSEDSHLMYQLLQSSFKRRKEKVGFSKSYYVNLLEACFKHRQGRLYVATQEKEKVLGACFLVWDVERVYLISTGMNGEDSDAITALIWEGIKMAHHSNKVFDFCGSMIPGIAAFFQSFGAKQEAYQQLSYLPNKFLKVINQLR